MTPMFASTSSAGCQSGRIERHVLLPVKSSNTQCQDPTIEYSDLSVTTAKPYVGLLFVAPGMFWGREENHKLEQEVAAAYGRHFGSKLIAVGCNETLTEASESLRSCEGPLGPATGTPGLLFWPSDGLRIRVSHDDVDRHRYTVGKIKYLIPDRIEDIVAELGLDDRDKSTLLVFANSFPAFTPSTACLFSAIQSRCRGRKTSVWGGYFNDDVSIAKIEGEQLVVKGALFVLIRLTGPSLDSKSTVIKCDKSRQEVDKQLKQLKKRFKLRRRSVLLISGPVEIDAAGVGYKNCKEFKAAAMKIFKERSIQVLGAFGNMPHAVGVDSSTHENNVDQRYLWHNCMSVMIITYD